MRRWGKFPSNWSLNIMISFLQTSKGMRMYNCRKATQSRRFDDSIISSSQSSDRSSRDLISNSTDVSHMTMSAPAAYHHSRITDRSQVTSMCDGSSCDNHIIPAYLKESARPAWVRILNKLLQNFATTKYEIVAFCFQWLIRIIYESICLWRLNLSNRL